MNERTHFFRYLVLVRREGRGRGGSRGQRRRWQTRSTRLPPCTERPVAFFEAAQDPRWGGGFEVHQVPRGRAAPVFPASPSCAFPTRSDLVCSLSTNEAIRDRLASRRWEERST